MSCPPSPGILAYFGCVLAMLLGDPLRLAALLLSLGGALSALALARRRADHVHIAWALGAVWLADGLGWLLAPALASGGPFTGWGRVLQYLDSARFLVWPAALQVMVGLSFIGVTMRHGTAKVLRTALPGFYVLMLAICVACYPALRGEALGRFFACIQANALVWSLVIAGTWAAHRRKYALSPAEHERLVSAGLTEPERLLFTGGPPFTPARAVASLAVALELLSLAAGPWWRGLFGAAYRAEQVILCVLYAAIVGVHAWALRAKDAPGPVPDRPLGAA
jgi:hypothetical protein